MTSIRRVAIITGGSTGIGLGIARSLATPGTALVLVQLPSFLEQAKRAAGQLAPAHAIAMGLDIRDYDAVQEMIGSVAEQFGQIDVLINNASITGPAAITPFLDCSRAKLDEMVDVNFKGTFFCSQAVARSMVEMGRSGNIVHIASVGAFAAQESASIYCATKAALVSLTQGMAIELATQQIRVNCVAPGDIETAANATMQGATHPGGTPKRYQRATPLGRRGQPQDIGSAVAYLVSEEAKFITGTTFVVDGGFLAY